MELLFKIKDIMHHIQDLKSRLTIACVSRDCKITSKKPSASRNHQIVNTFFQNGKVFKAFLLCFCLVQCVHSHIVEKPLNEAKRIGGRVIMKCASNSTVEVCGGLSWEHYKAGNNGHQNGPHTNGHVDVVQGGTVSALVSDYISLINSSRGSCSLEVKVNPKAGGKYRCVSIDTNEDASAELIVLDGPECLEKTGATDLNNVTCSVRFYGNVAPAIKWIQVIGQNCTRTNSTVSSVPNQVGESILLPVASALTDEVCRFSGYKCIANFSRDGIHWNDSGKNVPDFEWASVTYVVGKMEEPKEPALLTCAGNEASVAAFATVIVVLVLALIVLTLYACRIKRSLESTEYHRPTAAEEANL